jgi:hypothetical protein
MDLWICSEELSPLDLGKQHYYGNEKDMVWETRMM